MCTIQTHDWVWGSGCTAPWISCLNATWLRHHFFVFLLNIWNCLKKIWEYSRTFWRPTEKCFQQFEQFLCSNLPVQWSANEGLTGLGDDLRSRDFAIANGQSLDSHRDFSLASIPMYDTIINHAHDREPEVELQLLQTDHSLNLLAFAHLIIWWSTLRQIDSFR